MHVVFPEMVFNVDHGMWCSMGWYSIACGMPLDVAQYKPWQVVYPCIMFLYVSLDKWYTPGCSSMLTMTSGVPLYVPQCKLWQVVCPWMFLNVSHDKWFTCPDTYTSIKGNSSERKCQVKLDVLAFTDHHDTLKRWSFWEHINLKIDWWVLFYHWCD